MIMRYIYEILAVAAVFGFGLVIYALITGPVWFLNRWLSRTNDEKTTVEIITAAPPAPLGITPGVDTSKPAAASPKKERTPRERADDMASLLRSRTLTLLKEQGLQHGEAEILAKSFATHERLSVIPFLTADGLHSEYITSMMPPNGPLQTAVYEMAKAVTLGSRASDVAAKASEDFDIRSGWHHKLSCTKVPV